MDTAQSIAMVLLLIGVYVAPILYAFYFGVSQHAVLTGWLVWIVGSVLMTAADFVEGNTIAAAFMTGWMLSWMQVALGGGLRSLAFKFKPAWATRVLKPSQPSRDREAP